MSGVLGLMLGGRTLTVSAPNILGQQPSGTPVSGSSTAVATGGAGPYTYAWTTSGASITYTGTTTATLTAQKVGTAIGTVTGTATVTATDTSSGATASTTITVTLENF